MEKYWKEIFRGKMTRRVKAVIEKQRIIYLEDKDRAGKKKPWKKTRAVKISQEKMNWCKTPRGTQVRKKKVENIGGKKT